MSIALLREDLKDVPGGLTMTMRYEDGGSTQVFKIGEDEIRLPGSATPNASMILAALEDKKKL